MSINIYVGNLSFDTNDTDLKGLFATYGEVVSAKVHHRPVYRQVPGLRIR